MYKLLKFKILLFLSLVFFSCDLSFLIPDKEEPQIKWQEYRINSNPFNELISENLEIDFGYEILEFKVKVTDEASEIDNVQLYILELDSIIYSTKTTLEPDIYVLKWNSTLDIFSDSIYTLKIKAVDSSENEEVSSPLIVNLDQSLGNPLPLDIISVINNENSNCIYWDSIIIDSIPDFSHYNIYIFDGISNSNFDTELDINSNYYCHNESSEIEISYNVSVVDTFGFESELSEFYSNLFDYYPVPINFTQIAYVGDSVIFNWNESPDVDFNHYELWFDCLNCEFSNEPFYEVMNISQTSYELNLFSDDSTSENLYPNRYNEFWLKVIDNSEQASSGDIFMTPPNNSPQAVNIKSINYSVEGINIEWYIDEMEFSNFNSYNIYHSSSETSDKIKLSSVFEINTSSIILDSSFISDNELFSFSENFSPFIENWFWVGVEDKFGNIAIGSGMTNLIDIPPPKIEITDWTYWKGDDSFENSPDTIIVHWESVENMISDFNSYTIFYSTVADSIEDTLGQVYNIEENSLLMTYNWDEEVSCNQAGELYFWVEVEDGWGQKTISNYHLFSEDAPDKPYITSIYFENVDTESRQYVIEWNGSLNEDFKSYSLYYRHEEAFSYNDVFDDNCNEEDNSNIIKVGPFTDIEVTQHIYSMEEEDWIMYFLVVTEDVWGQKSFSSQEEYDVAEKATPFNQIVFQSNRNGLNNIYSVELDFEDPGFPRLQLFSNDVGESYNPSFEPWGARITFYGRENGNFEIFSIGAGGRDLQNLTNHSGNDYNPKYTSNGSRIIFESVRTGNFEIYSMNKDGSGLEQLTFNNGNDKDFNITNNISGTDKIVYSSTIAGNLEIFVMNEDGTEKQNITNHPEPEYDPDISDDGSQIIYIGEVNNQIDLFWYNIETGDSLNFTDDSAIERNPYFVLNGFYPNGEIGDFIVYESNSDGSWSIYFQEIPTTISDFDANPIDLLSITGSDQVNPNFANIILNDIEGVFMVYESTEDGTSSIYLSDETNSIKYKISDELGDDYLPQIQP
jgi:hypothetical protein